MSRRESIGPAPGRLASLSASVRRGITWGAVEFIGSVVPKEAEGRQAWRTASPGPAVMPVKPRLTDVGHTQLRQVQQSKLPTPCRNAARSNESQRHGQGAKASPSPTRQQGLQSARLEERARLLQRVAALEEQRDSMEAELQKAQIRGEAHGQLVQTVREHIECGVCLLPFCWPVSLDCGHSFCRTCIEDWELREAGKAQQLTCPTCRAPARSARPAHALHNVCVALEDPTSACRRTQEDEMFLAMGEALGKDGFLRRQAASATRRRGSMVFLGDGHEMAG